MGRNKNITKSFGSNKIPKVQNDVAMVKISNIIQRIIWAAFGITAVLLALKSTSRYGVGMSPDAVSYISVAEHLLQGKGYTDYLGEPYVHWGPLLPSLLALIGLTGIEPLTAARFVNALCFGITVFCAGVLFAKRIKERLLVILGIVAVLTSFIMLQISMYAWTEPLFNILIILFLLNIVQFLKSGDTKPLLLAAVCSALACVQRYVGLTTVIAGNIFILLLIHNFSLWEKLKRSALFSTIACVPVGIWVIRNKLAASTLANFYPDLDLSALKEFTRTLNFVTPWFVPANIPLGARLAIIGTFVILLAAAVIMKHIIVGKKQRESAMLVKAVVLFILIYVTFTMTASILVNAEANDRLFTPIFAFLILLILIGLEAAAELLGLLFQKKWAGYLIVIALCGLWLAFYTLPGIAQRVNYYEKNGAGLNSAYWRQSPLINWLREHPPQGKIFSNEPFAIYFQCGFGARLSPRLGDMENFKRQMSSEKQNYLVWHFNHWRTYLYGFEEISSQFKLKPLAQLPDGVVFVMDKK